MLKGHHNHVIGDMCKISLLRILADKHDSVIAKIRMFQEYTNKCN